MGLGPSLDVARDHLARHGKAHLRQSAHPEPADTVSPFQFGVCPFDPCPDLISVLPFGGLLEDIHMIPQTKLGGDLQTEVSGGIAGLAAFGAMVGGPNRTTIEHRTCSACGAIEDRMERTAGGVVGTKYPMVDRFVSPGTLSHKTA